MSATSPFAAPSLRPPTPDDIVQVRALRATGRLIDAHHLVLSLTPPESWDNTSGAIQGIALISALGAARRAYRAQVRLRRAHPDHAEAYYYYLCGVEGRYGPLEALRLLESCAPDDRHAPGETRAALALMRANLLATFRDFQAGEEQLVRAREFGGETPWFWIETARFRERQDRGEEALAAATTAHALAPQYPQALHALAHLLSLQGRETAARDLLRADSLRMQSASVLQFLAQLELELDNPGGAVEAIALAEAALPLAETPRRRAVAAQRADALSRLGRLEEAATAARIAGGGFSSASPPAWRRPRPKCGA